MHICTVSFFGHRLIEGDFWELDEKLREIVRLMINRNYYTEFLVSTGGDFDRIVSSAIKHEQKLFADVQNSLVLVLPYIMPDYIERNMGLNSFYNDIEICEESCNAHPKAAYGIRNRAVIDRSDLAVFYVNHAYGGAYQAMKYALKTGKKVYNLGTLQNDRNFDIYNSEIHYAFEPEDYSDANNW